MDESGGIKLIVGLGNPGPEYRNTRHNAGFMVVNQVLKKLGTQTVEENICRSVVYEGRYKGRAVLMQQPQTFMNLSGEAVKGLIGKRRIEPCEILVVYDDMDLPLGRMRIRRGGSAGGHHGIESIIKELQSADFVRVRIGIGRGAVGREHVLECFDDSEQAMVQEIIELGAKAILDVFSGSPGRAMTCYNAIDLNQKAANDGGEDKQKV